MLFAGNGVSNGSSPILFLFDGVLLSVIRTRVQRVVSRPRLL